MKAYLCTKYGSADDLILKEVKKPSVKDNEVLVRVCAASVNYNTLLFVNGKPWVGRTFTGFLKPNVKIIGNDISGVVEKVGKNTSQFKPGDEVFGDTVEHGFGAFGEYVSVPEKALSLKPKSLSMEEAAALPEAGLVALQAIRDHGNLQTKQKVLVYGASGGIGSFAVQIAKSFGAEVTGLCSTRNVELVSSLGADHIIDYTKEDFTENNLQYDLIIATAGYQPIRKYKSALKPGGKLIITGGKMKQIFQGLLFGPWISMFGSKKIASITVKPNKDLDLLKDLIEEGKVKVVIDEIYPFEETIQALKHYDTGRSRGKVIIKISDP